MGKQCSLDNEKPLLPTHSQLPKDNWSVNIIPCVLISFKVSCNKNLKGIFYEQEIYSKNRS